MTIKDAYFNLFDYFSDNLNASLTNPIDSFNRGYVANLADLPGRAFIFTGYAGRIDDTALTDPGKEIDLNIFCHLQNNTAIEEAAFDLLDEINEFIQSNPTMAGFDLVELTEWEIGISDDMTTGAGLALTLKGYFR